MRAAAVALLFLFAATADARSLQVWSKLHKGVHYCDPDSLHDECGNHHFWHKYECVHLGHEKGCSYKKECTDKKGPCKSFKYKEVCEDDKSDCKVYEQEEKCEEKQVCKKMGVCKPTEPPCEAYGTSGKCVRYGPKQPCKGEEICEVYERQVDCKFFDTDDCKEYNYERKCRKVKTDECEAYEKVVECKEVKVGCKTGICVKNILGHFKKG